MPLRPTAVELPVEELLAIVSNPETAPAAVGSNSTLRTALWLGFKVSGKLAPETLKPLPVTAAPLTVTGAPPSDVKVSDWVAGTFNSTLPKATLVAFTPSADPDPPSWMAKLSATLPAVAVRFAVCALLTEATLTIKLTLVAPAGTVTEAGTVTALLSLASKIVNRFPDGAVLNVAVQLSVPALVIDALVQLSPVSCGHVELPSHLPLWPNKAAGNMNNSVASMPGHRARMR